MRQKIDKKTLFKFIEILREILVGANKVDEFAPDRRFHGGSGPVHNARQYLEQRRLQGVQHCRLSPLSAENLQKINAAEKASRKDNWGNETATAREKEIAEEEERKNKEAKCKVCNVRTGVDAWAGW